MGLIAATAVVATTAPASATVIETVHLHGTLHVARVVIPCSRAPGSFDATFSGIWHTTTNADGTLHHHATVHGTETFTPEDPARPSYTGRFTAQDGQNGAVGETITSTATFHDTLTGSDGSRIRLHGVFHATTHADGGVSSSLDRVTLTCP